ncbi:MAG: GNAT family N-acetyltransferase [Planctomycetota bacterium]
MPETMDQLYERYSPKNRSNLRRLIRRLERAYPGQVRVRTYTDQDQVQKAIDVMARISAQTYQFQLNGGFVETDYTRDMLKLAAKRGWLRACVLFIGEEPSAYELALRYGKSYFGLYTGFDPKWRQFRVGTVMFLNFLESICGDPMAKSFDFGFGDAEYKRLYSDQCWEEASVYIFASRLYPIFVNALRSSTMAVNVGMKYVANKVGVVGLIKRKWRNVLRARSSRMHAG